MKLVIICTETKKKAKTDDMYIDRAIRHFYCIDHTVKIDYEHFQGNGGATGAKIPKKIEKLRREAGIPDAPVVYCVDTDSVNDPTQANRLKTIEAFCAQNKFRFVWMCETVEEVFLGRRVKETEKVAAAKRFAKEGSLGTATEAALSATYQKGGNSNLLLVFDEILPRSAPRDPSLRSE